MPIETQVFEQNWIQSVQNIGMNSEEIFGYTAGIIFILTAVLMLFIKRWSLARKYFWVGGSFALGGFLINLLLQGIANVVGHESTLASAFAIVYGLIAIFTLAASFGIFGLPWHIARKRGAKPGVLIVVLSLASIILPILLSVALVLAHRAPVVGETKD